MPNCASRASRSMWCGSGMNRFPAGPHNGPDRDPPSSVIPANMHLRAATFQQRAGAAIDKPLWRIVQRIESLSRPAARAPIVCVLQPVSTARRKVQVRMGQRDCNTSRSPAVRSSFSTRRRSIGSAHGRFGDDVVRNPQRELNVLVL